MSIRQFQPACLSWVAGLLIGFLFRSSKLKVSFCIINTMDNRLDQSRFDNDPDAPSRYSQDPGGQMGETSGVSREPSYIEPGEGNNERTYDE